MHGKHTDAASKYHCNGAEQGGGNEVPRGSKELTGAKKEEIITACAEPYKIMSFREITLKEIGSAGSLVGGAA